MYWLSPGKGKYSATENGTALAGSNGKAIGPRSFSRWRNSASRRDSPYITRPETSMRVIAPVSDARSSIPTSVTLPRPSTRTGTPST